MRIYFGHSKDFDFINEFYCPIEKSELLKKETLLFPHKLDRNSNNLRAFYSDIDLFIAETTFAATGLGMELGWAYDEQIPIYCFYKKGYKAGNSLKSVSDNIIEYDSTQDMVLKIENIVENINVKKYIKIQ